MMMVVGIFFSWYFMIYWQVNLTYHDVCLDTKNQSIKQITNTASHNIMVTFMINHMVLVMVVGVKVARLFVVWLCT